MRTKMQPCYQLQIDEKFIFATNFFSVLQNRLFRFRAFSVVMYFIFSVLKSVSTYLCFSVSSSDYPFGYWFPPFCNGPCAGVPIDISKKVLTVAESRKQSSFGLEDVLFTGIYRQIANVTNIRRLPYICEHFR